MVHDLSFEQHKENIMIIKGEALSLLATSAFVFLN